jgi:hypothetical protein
VVKFLIANPTHEGRTDLLKDVRDYLRYLLGKTDDTD